MHTFIVSDEDFSLLNFAISCRLDDYEQEIRMAEKKTGKIAMEARVQWAKLARLKYRLSPSSVTGLWTLLDGTTIDPSKKG